MNEDDDILAAEYALGLLSPEEATATEARMRTDGPLSLRVAWWRDQLQPLVDEVAIEPGADVWPRIAAGIGANDNIPDATRSWKWATGGLGALAAALLAVIALRPDPAPVTVQVPSPVSVPLVAGIAGEDGTAVTVAFDETSRRILVTPVALDAGAGDAELWIIPVGATAPVSLGIVASTGPTTRDFAPDKAGLLRVGATFAISREAKGGSTTDAPQGPVIATGKIVRA